MRDTCVIIIVIMEQLRVSHTTCVRVGRSAVVGNIESVETRSLGLWDPRSGTLVLLRHEKNSVFHTSVAKKQSRLNLFHKSMK